MVTLSGFRGNDRVVFSGWIIKGILPDERRNSEETAKETYRRHRGKMEDGELVNW
jgi:hypothetical protein